MKIFALKLYENYSIFSKTYLEFLKENTFINFYWNELIYNVVLVSAVEQSESIIHIHISTLFFAFFSHIGNYSILSRVPCAIQ